jgi:hypothetical protein
MDKLDSLYYHKFCNKSNLHKSLNTLKGIIAGVVLDGVVNEAELNEIRMWIEEQKHYLNHHPFSELIPLLEESLEDGILDQDELEDINWFLEKAANENEFYDLVTSDLQVLQGVLHGILADGVVEEEEVKVLSSWLDEAEHLKGCYPYDEIYSILLEVLEDGKVDEQEQELLKAFFADFVGLSSSNNFKLNDDLKKTITTKGVCTIDPSITFRKKKFVFTGHSHRAKRSDFKLIVERGNGIFLPKPNKDLNYLVYGAGGNQCWAYSCYGRKVEKVIQMRKEGHDVQIIHENDFWDAVLDAGLDKDI